MKPDRDTIDEYFEYDAEEFLVSLALLITEGRTPEYSVKGRTEGFHCPPAQSSQPVSSKHECSDKLAQCRQARRTRSEVVLLWRNNIPIMVEVMLLPDCCYSDEGPATEGNDLNDPAIKQDALLLERWILEPVPRQSGDRFIEEKTLLLAIRSFVFFSQLSAWLSVSHGSVPRNILYRVSAADVELQWNFSQSPSEHVFPVPNVSHNVALKVSVQSLPRQSNYPVLNCSIHTNLGFYEKRIQKREHSVLQHCDSLDVEQCSMPSSQRICGKQTWTLAPEGLLHARSCLATELSTSVRNVKLYPTVSHRFDIGTSQSKVQCYNAAEDSKTQLHETPDRTLKPFSSIDPLVSISHCPRQAIGEANPLIGSLLQERQEVIARIAQHLLHCDPTTSHIAGRSLGIHEPNSVNSKNFWSSYEDENVLKKAKETSVSASNLGSAGLKENYEGKNSTPDAAIASYKLDSDLKTSPKPQARRKLILAQMCEPAHNIVQQPVIKSISSVNCINISSSKTNKFELPNKAETITSSSQCKDKMAIKELVKQCSNCRSTDELICPNESSVRTSAEENSNLDCSNSLQSDNSKNLEGTKHIVMQTSDVLYKKEQKRLDKDSKKSKVCEQNSQLVSIENYLNKDHDGFKCKDKQDKLKYAHDENEDPINYDSRSLIQKKSLESCVTRCERLKIADVLKTIPLKHSNIWKKHNFRSLDGTSTKAFHPRTGLPLLSSPVPQRKTQSGYFDLDTSLLQLKSLSTKSEQPCLNAEDDQDIYDKQTLSSSAPPATSLSLLGNFEESVLNYRLEPLGIVDGFKAEVGASGVFCPTHLTLPVEVSFYSVSDDNAPSPYMGVITLESLGKRGYRVPPSGTIQVTLFNPNKTVVKMFVVIYNLQEMPANHQTFLRQRTFSVPVKRDVNGNVNKENVQQTEERILRYLIHLRFQSSKSGKIYLHRDVRLLFSRKSMEVDSGAAYELQSYTDAPTNPQFSPRC
ncbi:protein FAM214A isoform X2 [Rhinatrema bivittatum]|uniref:protein FAM214A isoform X2 n=1 Tax=Rhinatrema bivittatum TaxID=194408 RepID=UPI001128AD21|nr:protein FAM214A isoform X2 [Rhinatrema bivittatum]